MKLPIIVSTLIIMLFVSCAGQGEVKNESKEVDPLRYQEAINQFITQDSLNPSEPGILLFVGSSSIKGWHSLAEDFSEYSVLNRGFGGSHLSDVNYYIQDLVFPHQPAAIFLYEGDNDVAAAKTPQRIFEDYLSFLALVRSKYAKTPVYFISIKPSPARENIMREMDQTNTLIRDYSETDSTLYYVDVYHAMLNDDGKPRPEIFGEDGLHMNAKGYALWTGAIKKMLAM